jgi:hypothetical protein
MLLPKCRVANGRFAWRSRTIAVYLIVRFHRPQERSGKRLLVHPIAQTQGR